MKMTGFQRLTTALRAGGRIAALGGIGILLMSSMVRAASFYQSPQVSTPSSMAEMWLAGNFSFQSSTIPANRTAPPLVLSSTGGIIGTNNLGISIGTGTFNSWVKAASMTATGQISAGTLKGDGSGIYNLSTGNLNNPAIATDTTTLFTQLKTTSVYLSQLWSSALSSYTALNSTGIAFSAFQISANSTMTALSISTSSLYSMLVSTGLSLSANWASSFSTYTALTSTAVTLSKFIGSANSTMTALSISTTTLGIATATLQGIVTALTISTTTLGNSTATIVSLFNAYALANSTVSTRIDQLQIFASTGQTVNFALGQSTRTAGLRLSSGAVSVYSGSVFLGNMTTLVISTNLSVSNVGSTFTLVAINTNSMTGSGGAGQIVVTTDNITFVAISTLVFPASDFNLSTGGVNGSSAIVTISGSTHIFTANQTFSSMTANTITTFGQFTGGLGVFNDVLTGNNGIVSQNISTYPTIDLTDGNNAFRMTTRNTPGSGNKLLILKDQTNGIERLQIDLSSGNFMVGGDPIGGLNKFTPTSAKFTVQGGSLVVQGANARAFVGGLIQTTSGFVYPDGTIQVTAQPISAANLKTYIDNANPVAVSSMNFPSGEFVWTTVGSSGTLFVSKATHTFAVPQAFLSSSSFAGNVTISSNLVINSTSNYDVPLIVSRGAGTTGGAMPPLSPSVALLVEGSTLASTGGAGRLVLKNPIDAAEVEMYARGGGVNQTSYIGSRNNTDLEFGVGDVAAIHIDTGTGLTDMWISAYAQFLNFGVSAGAGPGGSFHRASSLFEVNNGSISVNGTNAGISVDGPIKSRSGGFTFPDGSTLASASIGQTTLVIGTSSAKGANVIGTTTDAFNFAISTAGGLSNGTSASIYVQDGIYSYSGNITTVPTNVNLVFSKGAVIKWDTTKPWNPIFYVSGTLTEPNLDITTSVVSIAGNVPALFQFSANARLIRPEIKLRLENLDNSAAVHIFLLFEFGKEARNVLVDSPYVSSFTIISQNANVQQTYLWHFNGSTNTVILNPRINGTRNGTLQSNRDMIELDGCDGVTIDGGVINWSERVLGTENSLGSGAAGSVIKGFDFQGTRINMFGGAGDANGIILLQQSGNVTFSSGNVIQNLQINYGVTQANPTINMGGSFSGSWTFVNNNIWSSVGGMSGGGFTVGSGNNNTIWIGNRITGTTACMSDAGTNTKFTGNDNFCNGVEQ